MEKQQLLRENLVVTEICAISQRRILKQRSAIGEGPGNYLKGSDRYFRRVGLLPLLLLLHCHYRWKVAMNHMEMKAMFQIKLDKNRQLLGGLQFTDPHQGTKCFSSYELLSTSQWCSILEVILLKNQEE